jgi:hypothetical protein
MFNLKIESLMSENNFLEEKHEDLKYSIEYCDKLIEQNSMQFEQKITYISAGAIGAILVFAKNNVGCSWLLISGLVILTISCMMNIYSFTWYRILLKKDYNLFYKISSHLTSNIEGRCKDEPLNKYIDMPYEDFRAEINSIAIKRTRKADIYNHINVIVLFIGIILISLYVISAII